MSFNTSDVKELIQNGFPVVSIGLHYYNYQNGKVILKDIIHNRILKEKVVGNFEKTNKTDTKSSYNFSSHTENQNYADHNNKVSATTQITKKQESNSRYTYDFFTIYAGQIFTPIGIVPVYFQLGVNTHFSVSFTEETYITKINYSCRRLVWENNPDYFEARVISCCYREKPVNYGNDFICLSGIRYGAWDNVPGYYSNYTIHKATHVYTLLYPDIKGTVRLKYPEEDIMNIRRAMYFRQTFFNFYQVEYGGNIFLGLFHVFPPPFWFIPIGEFGLIKYTINKEGKLSYHFLPLTYFYYGIFVHRRLHIYDYDIRIERTYPSFEGSMYIEGEGCSVPYRSIWKLVNYHYISNHTVGRTFIPSVNNNQNLYIFKENKTSEVDDLRVDISYKYHREWTFLKPNSCDLEDISNTEPRKFTEHRSKSGDTYYWDFLMPPAYLYRPALIGLTQPNKLLYINPRR